MFSSPSGAPGGRFGCCALLLCVLLVLPAPAHGWGAYGHQVIGHLAHYELSHRAREAVDDLLGDETLASIGPWADRVRSDRPATAPLHYMNGPRDRLTPRERDFPVPQGNVYTAILGYAEVLADVTLPRARRVEALKFLTHFIGDLHQPLHCGFADDRGGNEFAVLLDGERSNLHRYWDRDILATHFGQYGPARLAAILHERFPAQARRKRVDADDPRDWVVEARAYLFAGLYPAARSDTLNAGDEALPVLDDAYREVWLPVAERQLARAGSRIAATLNAIFERGTSPFPAPPVALPTD